MSAGTHTHPEQAVHQTAGSHELTEHTGEQPGRDDDDTVFIADAAHGGKAIIFLFAGKEQADDEGQPGAGPERLRTAAFRKTEPDKADDEYSQGYGTAQDTAIHIESFFFRHMPSTSAG